MSSNDQTIRLAVLLSGRGSNLKSIVNAINTCQIPDAKMVAVLSNVEKAPGIDFAKEKGLPVKAFYSPDYTTREEFDGAMADFLTAQHVDWVILAGYNRILSDAFLKPFEGRVVNIHPSLLPKHGGEGMVGLAVHQSVIDAGETESGCTVHGVTAKVDAGPVLAQKTVDVSEKDTAESLAEKVLKKEHLLYPQVVEELVDYSVGAKASGKVPTVKGFLASKAKKQKAMVK